MNNYILSCCSTADMTKEHFQKRNISYICFHFELDGKSYLDDLGESIAFDKFYQAMVDGADTKTSQINAEEFMEYFDVVFASFFDANTILEIPLDDNFTGTT